MIQIDYVKQSPNYSERKNTIKKITIHHMAGNLSVEECGEVFQTRHASSNYGIGSDGRVGMYVPEKYRAWSTENPDNDHQAINIELANATGAPQWYVSDKAIAKCIDLCEDICRRYGFKMNYTGDKSGNVTLHKWFVATECPGPYLESKIKYICDEVNKRLGSAEPDDEYYPIIVNAKFITYGSTGKWVKIWQSIIGVDVDGSFGPITSEYTKKFQTTNGLEADNKVGPLTWQKGFEVIKND